MLYLVYLLVGVVVICGLLCVIELIVRVWESADKRSRMSVRPAVYMPAIRNVARVTVTGSLPDREAVSNVYSLSDHFADRFREVVNS